MTELKAAGPSEPVEVRGRYARFSIYTAIGVLVAGALLVVAFVLTGAAGDLVFRSFITLALLAGFSFAVIGESIADEKRYGWVTLAHIGALALTLVAGIWHIWSPIDLSGDHDNFNVNGFEFFTRFWIFIVTAGVLQLVALVYSALGWKIKAAKDTGVWQKIFISGVIVLTVAAFMFILAITFPNAFAELAAYWRIFGALAIIATTLLLVPVIARGLNPRPVQSAPAAVSPTQASPAGWYPSADPSLEIFWDGSRWTDYTRPAGVDDEEPPTGRGN